MAEKRAEIKVGQKVRLVSVNGPLQGKFEVIQVLDRDRIRLVGPDKTPLRAFRCRVKADEESMVREKEDVKMETGTAQAQATQVETKEAPKPPKEKKEKAPKAPKAKKAPEAVDLKAYCKQHGGEGFVLLKKTAKFESPGYTLEPHVLINNEKHIYRTFNVYKRPGGVLTADGGNEYPLQGKKTLTVHCKSKNGADKTYQGKSTAEQKIAELTKKGYVQVTLQ